ARSSPPNPPKNPLPSSLAPLPFCEICVPSRAKTQRRQDRFLCASAAWREIILQKILILTPDVLMWHSLEQSLTRYRELEQQMSDPAVIADRNRYTQAAKEHGALAKMVKPYLEYQKVSEDVSHAEALAAAESDPEMRKYAEEELVGLRDRKKTLGDKLEELLL